jgi:hypothetical protein
MNLHDDFDPRQPDLALVCKDDKVVHAHSYLLMLASQPLLPAIKMALAEAASGRSSHRLSAPAGPCADAGTTSHRRDVPAGMAAVMVQQDTAESWELLLQFLDPAHFLDPTRLYRPEITWVSGISNSGEEYEVVLCQAATSLLGLGQGLTDSASV